MKNIAILNFSARNNGNCAAICGKIKQYYHNANVCVYNVGEQITPCCNCDYECLKPEMSCPNTGGIAHWMDAMMQADLIYYVVPNYCGYPCGAYFAFNERKIGYFGQERARMGAYMKIPKKFIIVSNTESQAFYDAMCQQSREPEILYLKTSKYKKVSIAGDLMESDEARTDLEAFLTEL